MNQHRCTVMTVVFFLGFSGYGSSKIHGAPLAQPQEGYGQYYGNWDAPPQGFTDIQRQGFRDGIEGARKDIENHRQPDPNNRDEYRHPDLPKHKRDAYREGFRRGYDAGIQHLTGGQQMQPMQPGYGPPQTAPPTGQYGQPGQYGGPGQEVMLRGFQDGMVGAMRDLENNRPPDPNNRDEFRNPNVPPGMQETYRDGFRHGYRRGMALLTSGPVRNDDFQRHAFEDGVAGALNDFANNRQPDPDNRDEFRNPHVPYNMQDSYRSGFRNGYQQAWSELSGYASRH